MKLVITLLLSTLLVVLSQEFPTIPESFAMNVEWNIRPENRSFSFSENYDHINQRVKFVFYNETDTDIEYFFLKTNESYKWDPEENKCSKTPWKHHRFMDKNGNLRGGAQLFGLGANATYHGRHYARNILCDAWRHVHHYHGTKHNVTTYTTWYFADDEWNLRGLGKHRVPVRVHTYIHTTHQPSENKTDSYHVTQVEITEFRTNDTFYEGEFIVPHLCKRPYDPIPLPKLPENFRTTISYTNTHAKFSWSITEYVDHQNQRERIDFFATNKTEEIYIDLKHKYEYRIIKGRNFECNARPIKSQNNRFEHDGQLLGSSQLFQFGEQYNPVYEGRGHTIRGIECDLWVSHFNITIPYWRNPKIHIHINYKMYYYFSVQDWRINQRGEHRIPIRIAQVRQHLNHTTGYDVTYMDFSNFIVGNFTGDDDGRDAIWHVPGSCLAAYTPIQLPTLPWEFDTDAEISANYTTFHFREYYDYKNNRARFDYRIGGNRTTDIYLVDAKNHFHINHNGKCKVSSITSNSSIVKDGNLRSVNSLLHFGNEYNEKYMGRHFVREIECDRWWINYTRNGHFNVINYYFSVEEWTMDRYGKHRVPIRVEIESYKLQPGHHHPVGGPSFWFYFDYITFHTSPPDNYIYLTPAVCLEESFVGLDAPAALGMSVLTGGAGVFGGLIAGLIFGGILSLIAAIVSRTSKINPASLDIDLRDTSDTIQNN
eukprot:gene3361-5908_t